MTIDKIIALHRGKLRMALAIPDEVSQNLQKSKDFLTEKAGNAVNSLTEAAEKAKNSLSQAVGAVSQTTEQAKTTLTEAANSISQTTSQAVSQLAQATEKTKTSLNEASGVVAQATEKAKTSLNEASGVVAQATEKAKTSLNETTENTKAAISEVTEKAKASLDATIHKFEELNRSVSQGMQEAINSYFNDFIHQHPAIYWIFNHPLQTLGIFILFVILLGGLLKAISNSIEKFWLFLLKSPIKPIIGLFGWGLTFLRSARTSDTMTGTLEESLNKGDREERLGNIFKRLDAIKQEQDVLLKELSALVKSEDLRVK